MSEIIIIEVMPQLIRNEEDTKYIYPTEFQNKVFLFESDYIVFSTNSCLAIPKVMFDTVLENFSSPISEQDSGIIELTEFNKTVLSEIAELKDMIKLTDTSKFMTIDEVNEIIATSFQNINRVIENQNDKLSRTIDLGSFQEWRDAIDHGIKEMFDAQIAALPSDTIGGIMKLEQVVDELQKNVELIQASIDDDDDEVLDDLQQQINSRFNKLTNDINKVLLSQHEAIQKNKNDGGSIPSKLSLGNLLILKEGGYSVEEIKQLRDSNLI